MFTWLELTKAKSSGRVLTDNKNLSVIETCSEQSGQYTNIPYTPPFVTIKMFSIRFHTLFLESPSESPRESVPQGMVEAEKQKLENGKQLSLVR